MSLANLLNNTKKFAKQNSPEILSGMGIAGVGITAYLTAKATIKAVRHVDEVEAREGKNPDSKERVKENAKLVWKYYVPPVISGVVTVVAIAGGNRAGSHRTSAAVAAYSITEKAFSEYKEKVVEHLGDEKAQKLHDEIVETKLRSSVDPTIHTVTHVTGQVLCCEMYTMRYFRSDMERLRKVENELNRMINHERYVTMAELYDMLGLENTSDCDRMGWDSDRLVEFLFTTIMSPQGEPCIAFAYNYVKPI